MIKFCLLKYIFKIFFINLFLLCFFFFKGYSCNFEDIKICGYINVRGNDIFDWRRFVGRIGSFFIGFISDYIYGIVRGIYI